MPRLSRLPELLAALRVEGRVATRSEISDRYGTAAFREGRRTGEIIRIVPGFYAHSDMAAALSTRLRACARWLPDRDAISGLAACTLHGLSPREVPRVSIVRARPRRGATPSWIKTRVLTNPPPAIWHQEHPVVTLECALIDAVWDSGVEAVKGLIIDAIREGKTSSERIMEALGYFPRIKHRRALIRFIEHLKGGVHSYLEYLSDRDVFSTPELQRLERQVEFWVKGVKYRVDAFDPVTKTAIELDSRKYHGSETSRRRDMERDAALASIGIQTLRFTYEQVVTKPLWCRRIILDTIAARRQLVAA